MSDFSDNSKSDSWNEMVYMLVISELYGIKTDTNSIQETSKTDLVSYKTSKVGFIRNYLRSFIKNIYIKKILLFFSRNDSVFIYGTYIKNYISLIKLQFFLKNLPTINLSSEYKIINKHDENIRLKLFGQLDFQSESAYISFARKNISKFFPVAYLEEFQLINKQVSLAGFPRNPKVIYTSIALSKDEVFKLWCAQRIQKGTKLIVSQHGGEYDTPLCGIEVDLEISNSDKFLTWGWTRHSKTALGICPLAFGSIKSDNNGQVLVVCRNIRRYATFMQTDSLYGSRYINYVSNIMNFLDKAINANKNIKVRVAPGDENQDISVKRSLLKSKHVVTFSDDRNTIYKELSASRLGIYTYNGTSFLEGIGFNIPSILLIDTELYPLSKRAEKYYDKLQSVGIMHTNISSLSNFLDGIYSDVDKWWNQDEVQAARNYFCKKYANFSMSDEKKLSQLLLSIA